MVLGVNSQGPRKPKDQVLCSKTAKLDARCHCWSLKQVLDSDGLCLCTSSDFSAG